MAELIHPEEKIKVVERFIDGMRHARDPNDADHRTYLIMKQVAQDMRAQLQETSHGVLNALGRQVEAARRQKARIGFVEVGQLQAVAEGTMAHWPAIRRALMVNGTAMKQGEQDGHVAHRKDRAG